MKKIFPYILLSILLGGCKSGHKTESPMQEKGERDTSALQVAVMPTLDCLPFYYAERCGIFEKIGLDIRLQTFYAQMDCDTAFARRHADVSYTDLIRAALMQSKGTGLYAIMQADGYHELVTAKSKRIRDIRHLKEKMVAIARHSVTDLLLDTVIYDAKLDPSTIYHPQINDILLRHDMLRNGTIDAAFLPEPYATQCKQLGDRSIYDSRKGNILMMTFIASQQAVKSPGKAEQIKQLIKGYNIAVEQINNGEKPDSIRMILLEYPVQTATIDSLKLPVYKSAGKIGTANVDAAIRFLRKRTLINPQYTGDTLINTQFVR